MGGDSYNFAARTARVQTSGLHSKSREEIFTASKVPSDMSVMGLKKRECFDSDVHPKSLPIIIALDNTGSMGRIPYQLIKEGLPTMIKKLHDAGIVDAAVCFVLVGDHLSDNGILQVGQFESGDEKLDHWLTNGWLEGKGGGNGGESYFLSWYFAARHTNTHAWTKRKEKGYIFTIGDERCHKSISAEKLSSLTGMKYESSLSASELLEEAKVTYNVYHINLSNDDQFGENVQKHWQEMLGENAIFCEDEANIPSIISQIVSSTYLSTVKENGKKEDDSVKIVL